MNKLFYILIVAISLCIVIVIASILITKDYLKGFELASNLIGSFSALITMIIALVLIDQFGVNKRFINYQTDSVIKLIEKLRNFNCSIKSEKITYQVPFTRDLSQRKKMIKNEKDDKKQLIFTGNDSIMEIVNDIINDPWLPPILKVKTRFLECYGTYDIPENNDLEGDKLIVSFGGDENKNGLIIGNMNVLEFIENIETLKKEISSWLQKYSSMKTDENLIITS